ncbi:MAG TPA: hypothetical protein VKH36_07045 [Acidimicrobiia bacterium]|nr:hypothetical protein [Acidimicrobiia bacterium]
MLLWYAGLSVLLVYFVFQSTGIDYRLVVVGSLLPLVVDLPFLGLSYGHALLASVVLLLVVMLLTIGRPRLLRRRLLCLPIGAFCGLALSAAWTNTDVFWWPFTGASLPDGALLPAPGIVVLEELAGLAACVWIVYRFALNDRSRRDDFLRSGRLRATASS